MLKNKNQKKRKETQKIRKTNLFQSSIKKTICQGIPQSIKQISKKNLEVRLIIKFKKIQMKKVIKKNKTFLQMKKDKKMRQSKSNKLLYPYNYVTTFMKLST